MSECSRNVSLAEDALKIPNEIPATILEDSMTEDLILFNNPVNETKQQSVNIWMKGKEWLNDKIEWETIELPEIQGSETFISENFLLCASNDQDLLKFFGRAEENSVKSNIVVHYTVAQESTEQQEDNMVTDLDKCEVLERALKNSLTIKIKPKDGKMQVSFHGTNKEYVLPNHNILSGFGKVSYLSLEEEVKSLSKIEIVSSLVKKIPQLQLQSSMCLWLCPHHECQIAFLRYSSAKDHTLLHFDCKPYKCDHPGCNWAFFTSFKLKRHKETHLKKKNFICQFKNCRRQFTTIYNLACHKRLHERPANFPCTVAECKEVFQTVRARELHLKTHGYSEAPYHCPVKSCNKSFFLVTALMSHSKVHSHKDSEVKCQWPNCGRVFEQPCRLKEHLRQHTGQRPYVCSYDKCKWSFTTASKLKRHLSTHTNDRKFQCTIGTCKKAFLRPEHLKEHTLRHIGQRNGCDIVTPPPRKPQQSNCTSTNLSDSSECPSPNILLERAVQSLEVPSDVIMGTGILPEETLELLPHESFEKFSTVNLKDLRNLD